MDKHATKNVEFRPPEPADATAAWELVANTPNLDDNSLYYYMIWFRDFADASLVATVDDAFIGFLTGYRRPDEPDVYFVWQEAVQPRHGIPDLGVKLFERAVEHQVATGAKFVEASVSAANKSIIMVLRKLAKKYSTEIEKSILFPADHFPGGHHDEILYRIGPLTAA